MTTADDVSTRYLLEVGRVLASGLDTRTIVDRVLEAARAVTGAQYAALGALGEERAELAQFVTAGVDEATYRAIGEAPRGRGVLGVLIGDPRPLRLADVGEHPLSFGFPAGHPPMQTFLGVPVMIAGEAWGSLYLTEKGGGGEFTQADEEAAVILAEWAGAALHNARLYKQSEQRRQQLESSVRELEATRDVAMAVGGETGLDHVLALIAERGRTLVRARVVLIMLREGEELLVAASTGHGRDMDGRRLPISGSTSGEVLMRGTPRRIVDVAGQLQISPAQLGVSDARTAVLVPMLHRGEVMGVLAAFDRGEEAAPFTDADEQLLRTFGASAANAVVIARSVEKDRLRSSVAAADAERGRWARELHDETLQIFGGLRVLLSGALRRGEPSRYEGAMKEAVDGIERGIDALRAIIADLRPAALDEIGLKPAIQTLLERRARGGLAITGQLALPEPGTGEPVLEPELETTIYRLVQEALTNTAKHSGASSVRVEVIASPDQVTIEVADNGAGFDPAISTGGFGLAGMRERVYLAAGKLEIHSGEQGTTVRSTLPARYADRTRGVQARAGGS